MITDRGPPLSNEDLTKAFRRATSGFAGAAERWEARAHSGVADEQLAEALEREIGQITEEFFGDVGIAAEGQGLKIWVGAFPNRHKDKPAFQGAETIRMTREVYGIKDPKAQQLGLF
jgi:hypothetical protein